MDNYFLKWIKVSYINDVYDIEQIQDTKYFSQIEKNIQHFRELKTNRL